MRRAVFLDRDGVINEALPRGEYVLGLNKFRLSPGIHGFIRNLNKKDFDVIVVTNQSPIARGLMSIKHLESIHKRMLKDLGSAGAFVRKVYYCPHQDINRCECRKPKAGLLFKASHEFDIALGESFMIGDSWKDIAAGKTAGCATVFLDNLYNKGEDKLCAPDFIADSFLELNDIIK